MSYQPHNPNHNDLALRHGSRRRGISVLWLVIWMPVLLIMLAIVVNLANLWLARVELENALEAAALAASKEWGSGGPTASPRGVGVTYAAFNTVRGVPLEIDPNLDPAPSGSNPNANLTCVVGTSPPSGNLIFGAISDTDPANPITFDQGLAGGCVPAEVLIDVFNTDSGSNVDPRKFGIFYDDGPAYLSIVAISITLPDMNPSAYFDAGQPAAVSIANVGADILNRNNPDPEPKDVRGLDPDPNLSGLWTCPNAQGDICFTFSNPVSGPANRYRTVTIHFTNNKFNTTNDPNTTDFVRFGASNNRLKTPPPPPNPGDNNDGDAFGNLSVPVFVVFYNSNTGGYTSASGVFVNIDKDGDGDFNDGWSEALISGIAGGAPAVWARATVPVNSLWGRICGTVFGPYYVSACATAMYDCATGRPRLIRPDKYICPDPIP